MKRRTLIQSLALGASSIGALKAAASPSATFSAQPRGTARNLIFVLLEGGPSHIDTFDFKRTASTPATLDEQMVSSDLLWPMGLMPKLGAMSQDFSIVRGISAVEAVHERGVYHVLTAHRPNAGTQAEVPHFASMLAFLLENQRSEAHDIPTAVLVGENPAKAGFLGVDYQGLQLGPGGQIENLEHYYDKKEERFALLDQLLTQKSFVDKRADLIRLQGQARDMMNNPTLQSLVKEEYEDSPSAIFVNQVELATKLLKEDTGARVIQLQIGGWDHHDQIYEPFNIPALTKAFDDGMSQLINELKNTPGEEKETLFDETLIVSMGEFGRTIGRYNSSFGRDHWPYVVPAFFAGGGIQGGRVIGSSDTRGEYITQSEWSHNRYMEINDVIATIYSAMGFDWSMRFNNTPSGRVFDMVAPGLFGHVDEIAPLF